MADIGYEGLGIEDALKKEGHVVLSTSGISMYPMLRHRKDMVVIKPANGRLRKHDVPLYRLKTGKLVLHRILKVTDNGYIIRGDNLYKKETDITDDNIIGVLTDFYRGGVHYNCATSRGYRVYIWFNRISYPIRYTYKTARKTLSFIKHRIFRL